MKRIIGCLSLMFILVACSDEDGANSINSGEIDEVNDSSQLVEDTTNQIKKLEGQNEELQATVTNLQTDLTYKKEEADYYKQFINELIQGYSNAQLTDLARTLWDYEMFIDGVSIQPNGIFEIQENTFEISLIERQPEYVVLPNDLFMQGKISGDYMDHLKVNATPAETYVTDGTVFTAIHHKFVDVEKGSTISFTITEELQKRLGLETTQFTIMKR